jgi:hypothetical protein
MHPAVAQPIRVTWLIDVSRASDLARQRRRLTVEFKKS